MSYSYTAKQVAQWLAERLSNCQVIAENKDPGADRDGWLEDAGYFKAALHLLADGQCGPKSPEVRLNDDKTLDEVVATGATVQLEQLDYNHWFLEIGEVAVWLHAKGKITANYELRTHATGSETSKEKT